ncbi:MAG: hypothetical protein LBI91_01070 [Spirochaetaceae bacterium]|jgi:hypothetical protein|nr:hypothetical protein [Spirochaetaceae bacterium]
MSANRQYKDSVFSLLFSDPAILRQLYSALKGTDLDPDVPVVINTLENALYMDRINDISFILDDRFVLVMEHQSTVNPNMPLRILMYIALLYEQYVGGKGPHTIYTKKRVRLPRPEFIVLYNGKAPFPEKAELKLSDSYAEGAGDGISGGLELRVTVYNINPGYNEELRRKCPALGGYSAFVDKVRRNEAAGQGLEEAIDGAVKWCIKNDILREFLRTHGEVKSMLAAEWKFEDALVVEREEGLEEGLEKGLERSVKLLEAYGMKPEQISAALKLSPEQARRYLEARPPQ